MQHPYGVLPEHVAELIGDSNETRHRGLGNLSVLTDNILIDILGLLDAVSLARCATISRATYVFCNYDELWKSLVLNEFADTSWEYEGTWQSTYESLATKQSQNGYVRKPRRVERFYSDFLHRSWFCANLEIDPEWLEIDNIDRRSGLTLEEFRKEYEEPNKPVILTDVVPGWPAFQKWSREYLERALEGHDVMVGDSPMKLSSYYEYSKLQRDELPLYLFDKYFAKSSPQLAEDYGIPMLFAEDLFSVLGEDERPDYRWLIIGPKRSGSTFHKDPNATSAWNAVISGAKKWVLYPPNILPPGVHSSTDGADVASPISIMEWFLSFYALRDAHGTVPFECTLKAGEVLFVPRSWWHIALNLEDTVAITQNFVSQTNLSYVLKFLSSSNSDVLVSGVRTEEERRSLRDRFLAALDKHRPDALHAMQEMECSQKRKKEAEIRLASCFKPSTGAVNKHDSRAEQKQTPRDTCKRTKQGSSHFTFEFAV